MKDYRNRPEVKERLASYYREKRKNPLYAQKYRNDTRNYQQKLRLKVIEKLGGICTKCKFSDVRILQIDHINGGGNKLRKTISWSKFYLEILEDKHPHPVQLLCPNCHALKKFV